MFEPLLAVLAVPLPRSSTSKYEKRGAGLLTQLLPWLSYPPPEYSAKLESYCSNVNAWQAPVVITGVLPLAPGLKRTTPSSVAQKLRTPEML